MDEQNDVLIRWDNAHEVPGIDTSPHHQHIGSETNIQPSEPMTLEKVLDIICRQLERSGE